MDNNNKIRGNFNEMLALADFAEKSHNDRRQVEFRITISYITFLVLALYQVIKPRTAELDLDVSWWVIGIASFVLLLTHICYCWWQRTFHIASNNDVRRRDFYLKKAECIAYYMSQNPDSNFIPSSTRKVLINLGAGKSTELTEHQLFKEKEPDIFIRSKGTGTSLPKWSVYSLLPLSASTTLLILLIVTLVLKKVHC